jgi:hypothetical protein
LILFLPSSQSAKESLVANPVANLAANPVEKLVLGGLTTDITDVSL